MHCQHFLVPPLFVFTTSVFSLAGLGFLFCSLVAGRQGM